MTQEQSSPRVSGARGAKRSDYHVGRRLFHMVAASAFPVLALVIPERPHLTALTAAAIVFPMGDLARIRYDPLNTVFHRLFGPLIRASEQRSVTGASYVLLGTLAAFLLFPRDVAVMAVLFSSLGDPIAALAGLRFPGRKRIAGKSLWGTGAMIGIGLVSASALHATGAIGFRWPVTVGAVVAGLVEIAPLPIDDNLSVPLAAGAVMVAAGMS